MVSNAQTTTLWNLARLANFKVACVIIPRVPSEPMNSRLISYPELFFLVPDFVLIMDPSARTIVRDSTQPSLIDPYLAAFIPEHPVAIMPPILAPINGSTGKNRFSAFSWEFRYVHSTPAWTVTSRSEGCNSRILSIYIMSIQIPP